MENYKKEFVDFLIESEALKFGDFTLKSGRKSPFFMNIGSFISGSQLKKLATFYAKAIHNRFGKDIDILFGPAYKGIPLAVATSIELYNLYNIDVKYSANRKELKDHGDVGIFLGDSLNMRSKLVIIEDVTTSGKSIEETYPLIKLNPDIQVLGLMVSVDRMEKGRSDKMTALDEIKKLYDIEAFSIVTMKEILEYLKESDTHSGLLTQDIVEKINAYYKSYGV